MLTVKELKEALEECNDNDWVFLEYSGCETEIERGNEFADIDSQDIEFHENDITIVFS
jgi:hypothetical protein